MATGANMSFSARFNDDEAKGFLQELINHHELEGPGLGIAKLVIAQGPGVLSEKQAYVFEQTISPHITETCQRGGCNIPWSEQYAAADNGGLCSWCWHMSTKDD